MARNPKSAKRKKSGLLAISPKNSKTGKIPSVSVIPVKDCDPVCRRHCAKDCYALKAYRAYPNTRKAYDRNSKLARTDLDTFAHELAAYLTKARPRMFRFNVAGDFVSRAQFDACVDIARAFPGVRFLAFTKAYSDPDPIVHADGLPDNFRLIISVWHTQTPDDIPAAVRSLPRAYAGPCYAFPESADAIECSGICEHCGMCWGLKPGQSVHFAIH